MGNVEEATAALQELGLTEYEARCFVALARMTTGTAKEISQVAEVPRSRVYDTVERLDERGLVDVQHSEPREYKAVPTEVAFRRLQEDYDSRIEAAENALKQVEEPDSDDDEGMWAIAQADHVTDRVVALLGDAESAVHHLVAAESVIDDRILDELAAAADRGAAVVVEVPDEGLRERFEDAVPDATVVVSEGLRETEDVYGEWPAQLLMVDRQSVVAAGVEESGLPDVTRELAVWTYGNDHGFAVWTRELLADRLPDSVFEE
ncbi:TrmB family transcriptional regulator [Halostella sp. JP-L12]|uniref:TrmB family transcriptional regulator n=1 Tax=Halostella TaxID=1843185 RepID=UPI000EF7C603|nr:MULTISPECIES: helix-turn-helix domain-containing protein [Halostella]NHN46979.1 TrmB family transcriptional regulator [Halostella sp. JP-L12]